MRQGYFIRGEKNDNLVILFLHGGLGSPEIPLIDNTKLEQEFTVCYWEQRGSSMSYSCDLDLETMTIGQFEKDTRQIADILRKYYGVDKVYLVGHSWSSYLGVKTVENSVAFQIYYRDSLYIAIARWVSHQSFIRYCIVCFVLRDLKWKE